MLLTTSTKPCLNGSIGNSADFPFLGIGKLWPIRSRGGAAYGASAGLISRQRPCHLLQAVPSILTANVIELEPRASARAPLAAPSDSIDILHPCYLCNLWPMNSADSHFRHPRSAFRLRFTPSPATPRCAAAPLQAPFCPAVTGFAQESRYNVQPGLWPGPLPPVRSLQPPPP